MNTIEYDVDKSIRKFLVSEYQNTTPHVWKQLPVETYKKYGAVFVYSHLVIGTVYLVHQNDKITIVKHVPIDNVKKISKEVSTDALLLRNEMRFTNNIVVPIEKKDSLPIEYVIPKVVKMTLEYYKSYLTQVFKDTKPNEWKMVDKYSNKLKEKIIEFKHLIVGNIVILRKENSIVINKPKEKMNSIGNSDDEEFSIYCKARPVPPKKPEIPYYIKTKMF